jgi:hypothetical protein
MNNRIYPKGIYTDFIHSITSISTVDHKLRIIKRLQLKDKEIAEINNKIKEIIYENKKRICK